LSNLLNAVILKTEAYDMLTSHIMWESDNKWVVMGLEELPVIYIGLGCEIALSPCAKNVDCF
jgi:hypothetical protein